jgi:hypothetical protein
MLLRSIVPLLRSSALATIATFLRVCDRSYYPALERSSADCVNIPEAVYVSSYHFLLLFCLIGSLSLIIYLFCLYLFIYLLLLVLVSLFLFLIF